MGRCGVLDFGLTRSSGLLQDLEAGYLLEEGDDFKAGMLVLLCIQGRRD
jgi:hypothetical protein